MKNETQLFPPTSMHGRSYMKQAKHIVDIGFETQLMLPASSIIMFL